MPHFVSKNDVRKLLSSGDIHFEIISKEVLLRCAIPTLYQAEGIMTRYVVYTVIEAFMTYNFCKHVIKKLCVAKYRQALLSPK